MYKQTQKMLIVTFTNWTNEFWNNFTCLLFFQAPSTCLINGSSSNVWWFFHQISRTKSQENQIPVFGPGQTSPFFRPQFLYWINDLTVTELDIRRDLRNHSLQLLAQTTEPVSGKLGLESGLLITKPYNSFHIPCSL